VKVTSREKRVLIYGSFIVAVIAIFYVITLLLPNSENIVQDVAQKKKMLLKHRSILNGEQMYKTRMEQYRKNLEKEMNRLLPGSNANLAAAELQKILKDFADQSGVEITQRNPLPDKKIPDMDTIVKISVRIETNCNPEQLVQFLTAIENYDKLLTVDEFLVTSFRLNISKKYEIRPSLTISGFISVPETPKTEAGLNGVRRHFPIDDFVFTDQNLDAFLMTQPEQPLAVGTAHAIRRPA
jgi:hypothetical protein